MEIYTIGFTQTTAEHFFGRLADARVGRLLDVRLNNSSQLAGFAKSKDLPYFLRELVGATYEHEPQLAPTDIGPVTPEPSPPESEDHAFQTANIEYVRDLDNQEFLDLLDEVCDADIQTAFGPALENVRRGYAIEAGSGERSLAVVRACEPPTLIVDGYGKLRLHVRGLDPAPNLSVADVRFYEADQKTIRSDVVGDVNARIEDGVGLLLMLGLPHPKQMPWDDRERHWLQLNGLVLEDRLVGDAP